MLLVFPKDQQQPQRVDDPRVAQQNLMQRLPQVVLGHYFQSDLTTDFNSDPNVMTAVRGPIRAALASNQPGGIPNIGAMKFEVAWNHLVYTIIEHIDTPRDIFSDVSGNILNACSENCRNIEKSWIQKYTTGKIALAVSNLSVNTITSYKTKQALLL